MSSTHPKTNFKFSVTFNLLSANAFNLEYSNIYRVVKSYAPAKHVHSCQHALSNLVNICTFSLCKPSPKQQILDSSKLKEFSDNNFEFDENGRKFPERVKNTRYEQFLLFPQCFQKTCTADM